MTESLRVLVLGICAYVSPRLFLLIGPRWFAELHKPEEWVARAGALRRKFWRAFCLVAGLVVVVICLQCWFGSVRGPSPRQAWRLAAIILALTATLGRGGWDIQSYKGKTIIERIDRGMYVVSQLGATTILLMLLLSES